MGDTSALACEMFTSGFRPYSFTEAIIGVEKAHVIQLFPSRNLSYRSFLPSKVEQSQKDKQNKLNITFTQLVLVGHLGPFHTYPGIFENGDLFLRFQTNTRPQVAYAKPNHRFARKR